MAAERNEQTSSSQLGPIVLKKYGNRRLYDTNASRYVTLNEVEDMVQRGTDVQVVDAKTGDDLTKEILVQIILDKDNAREMLPTSFLKQVVRLSSSPLKESFSRVLQDSLDGFLANQRALVDAQRAMLQQLPTFGPQGVQGLQGMWNPFAAFGPPPGSQGMGSQAMGSQHGQPVPTPAQVVAAAKDAEMDRLRAEMNETQALLRQLIEQGADKKPKKPGKKPAKRA